MGDDEDLRARYETQNASRRAGTPPPAAGHADIRQPAEASGVPPTLEPRRPWLSPGRDSGAPPSPADVPAGGEPASGSRSPGPARPRWAPGSAAPPVTDAPSTSASTGTPLLQPVRPWLHGAATVGPDSASPQPMPAAPPAAALPTEAGDRGAPALQPGRVLQEHWTNEREALIAERSALVAERESLLAQRAALGQFGEAAPGPDAQAGSAQRKRGGLGHRRNGAADGRERNETETDLRPRHTAPIGRAPSADLADLPAAERRPGDDVPGAATARLPAVEPDHVEDPAPDEHTGAEAQDGSRTGWSRRTLGWLLAPAEEPERDDDAARSEEDQGVPAPEEHGLPPRRLRPDVEPAAARSETAPASPDSDLPSRLAAANAAATARALASESYDSPAAGDTDDGVAQRRRVSVRAMIKLLVVLVLAGAIAALLRSYVIAPYYIPSASMEPTLHGCKGCNNDHVLADKLSYKMHDLHRGDVVVFHRPTTWLVEEKVLIKRVIGLPGDTLTARNGVVYIDGLALAEPYVDKECQSGTSVFTPITVPDGQAFVMGDNRCDSSDSRRFGAIADSDVIGRAAVIIWPLGRLHWL